MSNIIGIATVSVGALTYIAATIPDLIRLAMWADKAQVLTFDSTDNATLLNVGDGDIFVTHLRLEGFNSTGERFTQTRPINKLIKPGEIISDTPGSNDLKLPENHAVVTDASDTEWKMLLDSARFGRDSCLIRVFFTPEDPGFLLFRDYLKDRLKTFKANATVHFYSIHLRKSYAQEVSMTGILFKNKAGQCNNS